MSYNTILKHWKNFFTLFDFRGLIYEWMEHYRVAVGISQPFRISMRANRRAMSHSARSVPGVLPSGFETRRSSFRRTPSAPPVASPKGSPRDPSSTMVAKQSHSFAEKARFGGIVEDFRGITLVVPTNEMLGSRTASDPVSTALGWVK